MTDSKKSYIKSIFYVFLVTTVLAFLFHLFGLTWFEAQIDHIPDPPVLVQNLINAGLKALELVFIYRILTQKGFLFCTLIAVVQTALVGFAPANMRAIIDALVMIAVPMCCRKNRWHALVDFLSLYVIMTLYGLLFVIARFGGLLENANTLFYTGVVGIVDYKLFIITLYLYIKSKGGIDVWKTKRKLFQ